MSQQSGVPAEFERVGRYVSKEAARFKASTIRSQGFKARVVADPRNGEYIVFRGGSRERKAQRRWQK